jgi:hypothetical protein
MPVAMQRKRAMPCRRTRTAQHRGSLQEKRDVWERYVGASAGPSGNVLMQHAVGIFRCTAPPYLRCSVPCLSKVPKVPKVPNLTQSARILWLD